MSHKPFSIVDMLCEIWKWNWEKSSSPNHIDLTYPSWLSNYFIYLSLFLLVFFLFYTEWLLRISETRSSFTLKAHSRSWRCNKPTGKISLKISPRKTNRAPGFSRRCMVSKCWTAYFRQVKVDWNNRCCKLLGIS